MPGQARHDEHPSVTPASCRGPAPSRTQVAVFRGPWMPGRARHDGGGSPFPIPPSPRPCAGVQRRAGRTSRSSRPWMPGPTRPDGGSPPFPIPCVTPASCRGPAPSRTHVAVIRGPGCRDGPGMTGGRPFPIPASPRPHTGSSAKQDARRGLSRPRMPGPTRPDGEVRLSPSVRHPGLVPGSSAGQDARRGLSRPLDAGTSPA